MSEHQVAASAAGIRDPRAEGVAAAPGGNIVNLPPLKPESVTLDVFMRTLTARCTGRGVVCMAYPAASGAWPAYEWRPGLSHPSASPYFTISTVKRPPVLGVDIDPIDEDGNPAPTPRLSRGTAACVETFVIVLDDISDTPDAATGGKVHSRNIPLLPTYRLETSPGNFQYGYLLEQAVEPAAAGALIDALRAATNSEGSQKYTDRNGVAGVNRLVRVPGSLNTKPGRGGWLATIREWEPSRVFTLANLAEAFGVTPVPFSVPRHVEGADTDLVLESLRTLGMVLTAGPKASGFYEITCPWAHEHASDPRPEAGYKPSNDRGVFHCHHSSCHGRNYSDLCEHLEQKDPEFAGAIMAKLAAERAERNRAAKEAFAANPLPEEMTANDDTAHRSKPMAWRRRDAKTPMTVKPARRLMSSLAIRGAVGYLASAPNVGKSQFAALLSVALATERHELIGEPEPFKRAGGVVFIGNEDDANEFERRVDACMRAHGLTNADLRHEIRVNESGGFKVVRRPAQYAPVEIAPEMQQLGLDISAERAECIGDAALVVVDTQAVSFEGIDENTSGDMAAAFGALAEFSQRHDVATLVIHHATKDGMRNNSADMTALRGSSAAVGSVRVAFMLQPPAAAEEASLPDAERGVWFKLVPVKASYSKFPAVRWFEKKSVHMLTAAEDGSLGATESTPACVYSATGPKLGIDTSNDDLVFRALSALIKRDEERRLPVTVTSGQGDRACKLFADTLGISTSDGARMQKALEGRKLAEARQEPVPGKGRTRSVLAPTAAGHQFIADHNAKLDGEGFHSAHETASTTEPATEGTPTDTVPGVLGEDFNIDFGQAGA